MKGSKERMVGLFFHVNGKFLFYGCPLSGAEQYGDFLVYPESHMEVWDRLHYRRYGVDFDYFPRGRVVYRRSDDTFLIYHDRCIGDRMEKIREQYADGKYELLPDEHYQCHRCNAGYVL